MNHPRINPEMNSSEYHLIAKGHSSSSGFASQCIVKNSNIIFLINRDAKIANSWTKETIYILPITESFEMSLTSNFPISEYVFFDYSHFCLYDAQIYKTCHKNVKISNLSSAGHKIGLICGRGHEKQLVGHKKPYVLWPTAKFIESTLEER